LIAAEIDPGDATIKAFAPVENPCLYDFFVPTVVDILLSRRPGAEGYAPEGPRLAGACGTALLAVEKRC